MRYFQRLIEEMAGKWNPKEFRDEYQDDLRAFIQKRIKQGKARTVEEAPPPPREHRKPSADIMALLKESVESVEKRRHASGAHGNGHREPAASHR